MKEIIIIAFVFCTLIPSFTSGAEQAQSIKSPDGKFIARISPIQKSKEGPPEFKIEFIGPSGKVTAREDFTSEGGDQGLSIDKAKWSPDSQFFVFTTFSSGGHMAWQFPSFFFDRRDNKIHHLNDFLPPIAEGDFVLKSPDALTITIWTPMTQEKTLDQSIELSITFQMRELTQRRKEQR
jgi:hypothetical protein